MRVAREEWRGKGFGQSYIDGVISGHIVPEFPYPFQENIMWISVNRKVLKVFDGLFSAFRIDLAGCTIAPKNLSHFKIKKMGRI
jgi:hypothetical protein